MTSGPLSSPVRSDVLTPGGPGAGGTATSVAPPARTVTARREPATGHRPAPPRAWLEEPSAAEPLRRLPSQHRSRIRVERILDAAGDLVADRGYEATTTSLIARRARVSPGSFYQFFADKRSVVQALSARNLAVFAERLDEVMVARDLPHWWDAVEAALDTYVDLCRTHPGFRAVRFGDIVDAHLLDPDEDNDSVVAARIMALLDARFGVGDTPDLRLAAVMTIKVADTLVRFAFARHAGGDEVVLRHTREMLRTHLEANVPAAPAADRPTAADPATV